MSIDEVIKLTVNETIEKLKKENIIRIQKMGTFKKVEKLLYNYPFLKNVESEKTQKIVSIIDKALDEIKSDDYFELIELRYFKKYTFDKLSDYFGIDVKSVRYNRQRIIDKLRPLILSDEFLCELFFEL